MNEESVAHQSKILEFNEQSKQFIARKKQFEEEETQRLLREAEWTQKENNARLKGLQHTQPLKRQKTAAGNTAAPLRCRCLTRRRRPQNGAGCCWRAFLENP